MRMDVVQEAMTWLDTPFHDQARVKGVGVDCAQMVAGIGEELGFIPKGTVIQNYSPEWHLHNREEKLLEQVESYGCIEKTGALEPGDLLCFQFGRATSHLGIYIGDQKFIHARKDVHKVVVNSLSGDWLERLTKTYSFPTEQMK